MNAPDPFDMARDSAGLVLARTLEDAFADGVYKERRRMAKRLRQLRDEARDGYHDTGPAASMLGDAADEILPPDPLDTATFSKSIYRLHISFDRGRTIEGKFTAWPSEVAKACGRQVTFYEPWGKHSEAWAELAAEHFAVVSSVPADVEAFDRLDMHTGPDVLGWLDDNEPGWRQ